MFLSITVLLYFWSNKCIRYFFQKDKIFLQTPMVNGSIYTLIVVFVL